MIRLLTCFSLLMTLLSCKSDVKVADTTMTEDKPLSTAENIAFANGFEHWKTVSQLEFTFNVDSDSTHFERSWIWNPRTQDVTMIIAKDTLTYNRKSVDSMSMNADKSFINDKYWLLAPFQLIWDASAKISEPKDEQAPISKKTMKKITLTYTDEGGYTPGDAYDFYYGDDYVIKEWVFRQKNSQEPSIITTWEDYEEYNGLKLAKSHKKAEGNWNLHFTSIKVTN